MNKQEILEKAKSHTLKSKKLYVEDWDAEVIVRQLSARAYVDISTISLNEDKITVDQSKFLNLSIIQSVFDVNGEQIFSNDDLYTILNMSADGYSDLVSIVSELNNMYGISGDSNSKNLKKTH